ncbi:MAG: carbon storage regulator [Pirellulaceae bacterium]|nr:carbon storage regulator [Pirellulaceae bacterium]
MLVLTRKLDERIHIGQDVTITIVRLQGNAVRIGIDAPRGMHIRRGELPASETAARRGERSWPERAITDDQTPPTLAVVAPMPLARRLPRGVGCFRPGVARPR